MAGYGKKVNAAGVVSAKVLHRVQILPVVIDQTAAEALPLKVSTPHMVGRWHICQGVPVGTHRSIDAAPIFAGGLADGPHRAVAHPIAPGVGVIGYPHRAPPTKKSRKYPDSFKIISHQDLYR